MPDVLERIATWQRTGLIDAETAERLRATIETAPEPAAAPPPAADAVAEAAPPAAAPDTAGSVELAGGYFGPAVQVAEAFAYLGVGFLASAWSAWVVSVTVGADEPRTILALGSAVSAVAFTIGFMILRGGDARRRRAAGVTALVATGYVATAVAALASMAITDDTTRILALTALAATIAATGFRIGLPALLTQFGLLVAATTLAGTILDMAGTAIFGRGSVDGSLSPSDGLLQVFLQAAWWIAIAILFGVLGLQEADHADDPAAQRRAGLTRLWAGLVIVLGVATAVTRSGPVAGTEYDWGPILAPWIADTIMIVIGAGLLGRAFRRQSTAFLATGALALLIGLTEFNATYLTDSPQMGLLVEGVILLAIGYGAHRLRSMLDRPPEASTTPAA